MIRFPGSSRGFALFLAALYFTTHVALVHAVETNVWAQRRSSISSQEEAKNPSAQYAALPSSINPVADPKTVLNQLPSINGVLPIAPKWSDSNKKKSAGLSKHLKKLLDTIPLRTSSIQAVYDAGHDNESPIVLLQDVHLNLEAQTNMAAILQELIDQKQISTIGVEGAFGEFKFSSFRDFPNKKIIKEVAETFLEKNLIAAPSFVGVTSPSTLPKFVGVDNISHYAANVQAYLSSIDSKERTVALIRKIKQQLVQEKQKIFSPELRQFDAFRAAYHSGDVGFGVYVKKLSSLSADIDFEIAQFLEAFEMERSLDFKKVDEERRRVIEKLTKALNEKEISNLVAQSLAYRMGNYSFGAYYQGLKDLCEQHGIALHKTPAFDSYIRYVLLSDGIKPETLFASVQSQEEKVLNTLAKSGPEKDLATLSEHLSLTEKLVEFSLTPTEWNRYQLTENAKSNAFGINLAILELTPFEAFYKEADIRSRKMVEKLLETDQSTSRVLVSGGFHTPEIAELLKKQKRSFVVLTPKITKVDNNSGSSYLSIFAQEKSSLERLFAGQKLFLNPAMVAGVGTGHPVAAENERLLTQAINDAESTGQWRPASFFDRQAKEIFAGKPGGYKVYTRWLTPGWETPFFGLIVMGLKAAFGLTATLPFSFTWPAVFLILSAALVITLIHAVLNRDWSAGALSHWFIGSLILTTPFAFLPFAQSALVSFIFHALWNHVSFLRPMAFFGFVFQNITKELSQLLASERGLVFTENADAIDAQLFNEAKKNQTPYLRLVLRDQADLDRLLTTITLTDGEIHSKEGKLVDIIRNGGVLFIDYNNSDPTLIEGFNSLYDPKPYYGSYKASPKLKVVGAIKDSLFARYPVSFYSRFRAIVNLEASFDDPIGSIRAPPRNFQGREVELFESPMVREALIGQYYLDDQGIVQLRAGELVEAVKENKPLLIRGGNWKEARLADLIRQIIIKGEIEFNGQTISVPDDFQVYRVDGDYEKRTVTNKRVITPTEAKLEGNVWIVNKENQDILFSRTQVSASGKLVQTPGLLQEKQLRLRITEPLADWVWHRIMHATGEIEVELLSGVPVPKAYRGLRSDDLKRGPPPSPKREWQDVKDKKVIFIEGNDLSFIHARVARELATTPVVFHVTPETTLDQFVASIEIETIGGVRKFRSDSHDLIKTLRAGKVVILEGLQANPPLLRQLETALQNDPYLLENNSRVDLARVSGRLIVTSKPSGNGPVQAIHHVTMEPSDQDLSQILAHEFPSKFHQSDFDKIMELRKIFATIPRPSKPGLYPVQSNFSLSRLRLLYEFDNWLEAFENVFIGEYQEDAEVSAFMRTMVRLVFDREELGRHRQTIHGGKLERVLNTVVPSIPWKSCFWQFADTLSLDLLKSANVNPSFSTTSPGLFSYIQRALVKHATGERRQFYQETFHTTGDVSDAPTINEFTQTGEETWQERKERIVRMMKKGIPVMLKGSPGTGKSFITSEIATELGFEESEIEGPITVGADIKEMDVFHRRVFEEGRTGTRDEAVARWAKRPRGLLIVDEANLTDPNFWNFLNSYADEHHLVIFTGNQDYLAGRKPQEFIQENMVTIMFPEFDEPFFRDKVNDYLSSRKAKRNDLVQLVVSLHTLFQKVGHEKGFSLRDVQELCARVNVNSESDWTSEQVVGIAWNQYQGIFDPEERLALEHLIMKTVGVSVRDLENTRVQKIKTEKKARYLREKITLVDSNARTVGIIEDFLAMRQARLAGQTLLQGKRGVIFEGPSGRGKDVVLIQALRDNGFTDAKETSGEVLTTKKYYHLNASLNYDEMVETIRQAQKEGSIVIVSEMNLLPSALLEGKLNDVLTGKAKEGFAFFATINSEDFGGREKLSTALQNRIIYVKENDYSEAELMEIAHGLSADEEDIRTVVKAHVWIRDQIKERRHHPTTRDLIRALQSNGASSLDRVSQIYGPLYLKKVLRGRSLPSQDSLLAYSPKNPVNNIEVLKKMATSTLPKASKPFTLNIDASDPTQAGGYRNQVDNSITLRAKAFETGSWEDVFWHETSHGIFSRDINGLSPSSEADPFNPLYQDLEDVRHTQAFDTHFPHAGLSVPTSSELRFQHVIRTLDTDTFFGWTTERIDRLTTRKIFQYALIAYAKGLLTREQITAMSEVIEGIYPLNPLHLALSHLHQAKEIGFCIPKNRTAQNEILFEQYRALKLMQEIREDYVSLPDDEEEQPGPVSEDDQSSAVRDSLQKLGAMSLAPEKSASEKVEPGNVPTRDQIARKKAVLEEKRRQIREMTREAVTRELNLIRDDLYSSYGVTEDRLDEMLAQLQNEKHPFSLVSKLRQINDPALNQRVADLIQTISRAKDSLKEPPIELSGSSSGSGLLDLLSGLFGQSPGRRGAGQTGMPLWVKRPGGQGGGGTGTQVGRRYPPSGMAHTKEAPHRKNPKPATSPEEDGAASNGNITLPSRNPELRPLTAIYKSDLDLGLDEFVRRRLEPDKIHGKDGTILDIERFISGDPTNAFIKAGGKVIASKKEIVVLGVPSSLLHQKPILVDLLHFLKENGFAVVTPSRPLKSEEVDELKREKGTEREIVTAEELQAKVEAVYFYAACRKAMQDPQSDHGDTPQPIPLDPSSIAFQLLQNAFNAAEKITNGEIKSSALQTIAQASKSIRDPERAAQILQEVLNAAEKITDDNQSSVLQAIALAYRWIGDSERAAQVFQKALNAAEKITDEESKSMALEAIVRAFGANDDPERSAQVLQDVINATEKMTDDFFKLDTLAVIGQAYGSIGEPERAAQVLQEALNAAEKITDETNHYNALYTIAHASKSIGDPERAAQILQEVLNAAEKMTDEDAKSHVLQAIALASRSMGDPGRAAQVLQKALNAAENMTDDGTKPLPLLAIAQAYGSFGEPERAAQVLQKALNASEKIENLHFKCSMLQEIAQAYGLFRKPERTAQILQDALIAAEKLPQNTTKSGVLEAIARASRSIGDPERAVQVLQEVLNAAEKMGDEYNKSLVLREIAQAYASLGEPERATQILQDALIAAEKLTHNYTKKGALEAIAKASWFIGDPERAAQVLKSAINSAEKMTDEDVKFQALQAIAQASGSIGDPERAAQLLQEVINAAEKMTDEVSKYRTLWAIAEWSKSIGDPERAAQVLQEAINATGKMTDDALKNFPLSAIAQAYGSIGDLERAAQVLKSAINSAEKMINEDSKLGALLAIAATSESIGDPERAAQILQEAINAAGKWTDEYPKSRMLEAIVQMSATVVQRIGSRSKLPIKFPVTPSSNGFLKTLKSLKDSLVNMRETMIEVRSRFTEDGQVALFDKLMSDIEKSDSTTADPQKPASGPPTSSRDTKYPLSSKPGGGPQQVRAQLSTSRVQTIVVQETKLIATNLVDLALATDQLEKRRTVSGNLIADLASLSPKHEVRVQHLIGSNGHVSFGLLMTDPRLNESEFFTVLERVATDRIAKKELSIDQVAEFLQQLALMGLPQKSLDKIEDAVLDTVQQVVVVTNGSDDDNKVKAIRKLVGNRRPITVFQANKAMDTNGRLILSGVNDSLKRQLGRGLENTLLILPEGMPFKSDVPEEILRALIIATINDFLQARLLTGPTLINIDKVARIIAQNA